jgi:4-hydroxybenzoate polyprenyltransferase
LLDCLTLALLYTLRIIAGASVTSIVLSTWLLAFSIFLFLSLAFVKRYAELKGQILQGKTRAAGRGYQVDDLSIIQTLGIVAGYAATLVLALYLNSETVVSLYANPQLIWMAVPLMVFWVSWMWLKAHRGEMHDDPIEFVIQDKTSLAIGSLLIAIFIIASNWLNT